jgi:2-oxoglutarate dehydrogenase E2 component (dihydrolipoamide succinyltransferase)
MKPFLPIVALTFLVALSGPLRAQTSSPADPAAAKSSAAAPAAAAAQAATPAPATTAAPNSTPAPAAALHADPVQICHDVQDHAPVEAGESFPSNVGTLCCFSKITGAESAQVYHRWYVGDKMVAEIPIAVKASTWRCWSRKTILPSWQGECRVDVATESGDVIGSAKFTLTAAAAAAPPAAAPPAPKTQG